MRTRDFWCLIEQKCCIMDERDDIIQNKGVVR